MDRKTPIPRDFSGRLAAARIYYGFSRHGRETSRKEFSALLGQEGAGPKSLQNWEGGNLPDELKVRGLIEHLVELTGLPEEFFYGQQTTVSERLERIEEALQSMELAAQNRALEAEQRFDEVAAAIDRIQARRLQ